MEQELVIVRINEVAHHNEIHRSFETQRIPLSKLRLGAEISISEQRKMNVISLNDEELKFMIDDVRCYTLNRYWQVLGTVKMGCYPTYLEEDRERFAFYFATPVEKPVEGTYERLVELITQMRENAEELSDWKNIPLAREIMHLFKDCCPLRDDEVNPEVRMQAMGTMAEDRLLSEKDLPRLFLSFYQYWELCNEMLIEADGKPQQYEDMLESLYDKLFKLSWSVDPGMTEDLYDKLFGKDSTLRFDFVQLSPEWEKAIYDIEKETVEEVGSEYQGMGFCFEIWAAKTSKAANHGIHWRSPHVMNPEVMFD